MAKEKYAVHSIQVQDEYFDEYTNNEPVEMLHDWDEWLDNYHKFSKIGTGTYFQN